MQIIQSPLGNNIHPLGIRSSLSNLHKMLLGRESHSLHSRRNFISDIQTKSPLVTSSKFFLSREHEPSIEPLIGWDSWDIQDTQDINSEFPLLEDDSSDLITSLEDNTINSIEPLKSNIPEIMPTRIENNTSNDTSSKINISVKSKSKSKKTKVNKSQQPAEKKSATKSKANKTAKSSVTKFVEESNIPINFNENNLLASDEPVTIEANLELPDLQLDIASENFTNNNDSMGIVTPDITKSILPSVEDKSTLFRNTRKEELQANPELKSSLTSAESYKIENISQLQQENILLDDASKITETSLIEFPLHNVDQTFAPYNNLGNNEQKIINEVLELVDISDIPVSPTLPQQDIETDQLPSIIDNKTTPTRTNLIQRKEALPTFTSPSLKEESPYVNSNFEAITAIEPDLLLENHTHDFVTDNSLAIEPDLLLENNTNDFVADNAVADHSLENAALLSTFISPDVDNTLPFLANDENIVDKHSDTPLLDVAVPDSKSSVAKSAIEIQQEIADTPVQLTPTLVDIENTRSVFTNSDSNEQLVALESQSDIAVNVLDVSDVSANIPLPQHESNIENTISESTENDPILALPEIVEAPTITAASPEIVEAPTITAASPEIVEAPTITATSPEIGEAPAINAVSSEIGEAPAITATSPEIDEAPAITATSPEIGEAPAITTASPEIGETASIFRKIIDNEQPVESEFSPAVTNPEISTFVDTSDNLTSPQNEVSTPPEVEQNAIAENLPAPKGYATGGHVTDSRVENRQQIAPSDTVPAMLTPGEFVINTRDAQKNLPLLHHINTGGTPHDIILPSLQTRNFQEAEEAEETTSPETPTKVDSFPDTSLQLKSAETNLPQISNSLISSSLGLDVGKQKLSILNSPQLNPLQNETIHIDEPSPQYSSPPLIFRKASPANNTSTQWSNTPSQWSSVEDLLNGNDDEFTSFNFGDVESNSQNYEFSHVSESPQVFAKHLPTVRGFADGGEVTPPDISREIQPITETIESVSPSSQKDEKDDTANLEALAREIYHRLRQRIEIERERHGGYSGRLPW